MGESGRVAREENIKISKSLIIHDAWKHLAEEKKAQTSNFPISYQEENVQQ
jgi:hypothetical protein